MFLALWPDTAVRAALDRLARSLRGRGRRVPREHLHLTLAFAGTIPASQADCLAACMPRLTCAPMLLSLDRLGHFRGPRVTWAGPSAPPAALAGLAERAHALCTACGIDLEPPGTFQPHVTLRRFAAPPTTDRIEPPVTWRAATLVLIESGNNGHPGPYRILARTDSPAQ